MKLIIPKHKLRAALNCAATKNVRYYLCGVHVEQCANGDVHIVASDGSMLFAGRLPGRVESGAKPERLTIPSDIVKVAVKGKAIDALELTNEGPEGWRLGSTMFKPIDGVYPDWRRVFGMGGAPGVCQVNFDLALALQNAFNDWANGGNKYVSHHATFCERGVVFQSSIDSSARGIAMAMNAPKNQVLPVPFTPVGFER